MTAVRCHARPTGWAPRRRADRGAAQHPRRRADDRASASRETGTRGEGGDRTLVIDAAAEDAVFAELEALHDAGARFTRRLRGARRRSTSAATGDVLVVIDPIDGSLNAKRGLPHHALSIAVADGPHDGRRRLRLRPRLRARRGVGRAARGEGALLDGAPAAIRRRASAAAPTASSSCSGSSPPTRAGSRDAARRARRASRTACARSARSRSRCARSPPARLRRHGRRCGAAARSTPPPAS